MNLLINWQKQVLKINLKHLNWPLEPWKVAKQVIRSNEPFTANKWRKTCKILPSGILD
jgi:hypothetical protein